MSTPSMREEFEAWLETEFWLDSKWNEARNCYDDFPAHIAFHAYQAGASRVAPLVEGVGQPDSVHLAGAQDVGGASEAAALRRALEKLCSVFPTDADMEEAGWSTQEINAACKAYDEARAAHARTTGGAE